jgi:hypothetical protein
MNDRPLASIPPPQYDEFLFAVACDNPDGTQISVLSALARMDADPWEEAARLSAMPKKDAEKVIISLLHRTSGHSCSPSEDAAIATRLVQILHGEDGAGSASATAGNSGAQFPKQWLVWLSFAIAISVFSTRHQQTTTASASISESQTDETSRSTVVTNK